MKIKILNLINSIETLNKLAMEKFSDGVTSYRLARNIKIINQEIDIFNEAKKKLFSKYGVSVNKDGKLYIERETEQFLKEFNLLLSEEVDLNLSVISPGNISGYSPSELLTLDWLFNWEDI